MVLELLNRSFPHKKFPCDSSYMRLVPKRIADKAGLIKNVFVYERFDIIENNKQFDSSCFSLDNLIAIGAANSITPIVMFGGSDLSIVDNMSGFQNLNNIGDENKA